MTTAITRPLSSSISSQFQKQKPVEWISSLIQRYQDQLPTNTGRPLDRDTRQLLNTSHTCIINVSKHHLHLIVQALVRVLKAVNSSRWTSEVALTQSRLIVLQTLLECLNEAEPTSSRNVERECCMKNVLDEMWQLISSCAGTVLEKATAIVARVGSLHSGLMLTRLETALISLTREEVEEEQTDFALSQLNLMSNVTFNTEALVRIINQINHHWPVKKEHLEAICNMLSSVLWKWIEGNSTEFSSLQHSANCQMSEACDGLFLSMNTPEIKRRGICWPVQMLLIAVSPCSLESIARLDTDSINLPHIVVTKRQFVDTIVSSVQSCHNAGRTIWSSQLQYACHAAVNLCKCATYVNLSDFFVFNVVQQLIEHVKAVLLSPSRPREIERSVLVDCFVSLFRLKFDNDVFRVCLSSSQSVLQLVLVESLYIISTQSRLHWWPKIDMVMSRSEQLRVLLMSVIEKVIEHDPLNSSSGHLPVSVSRSWQKMSGKLKAERVSASASPTPYDQCSQQALLIAILKLVAAQPTLLIRQRGKEDEDCVESVVSALVLLIDHPNLHTEAMQALLALHSVIPQWNSQSPKNAMQTFFSVSSHMLFSVCQKLLHFQIPNAENVITWLKAIIQYRFVTTSKIHIIFRINYLKQNFDLISEDLVDSITTQSLVKFEAVIFLYLWSCDSDLVLCCLSLFSLNSIHSSQISATLHSPLSYHLSSATNIITAGRVALQKSLYKNLRTLPQSNAALNEAWHESYRIWELFTNNLALGSKDQVDFIEHVTRIASYSYINSDLAQNMLDVWSNVSGFLCSTAHLIYSTEQAHVMNFLIKSLALLRLDASNGRDVMCKNVKELISFEMDYSLDYFILHVISGQLSQNISNNRFVEHIIYILKNMLSRRATIVLKTETTIQMVSSLLIHSEQPGVRLEPATFGDTISTKSSGSSGLAGSLIAQQKAILLLKKMSGLFSLILENVSVQKIPTQLQSRLVDFFINSLVSISGYGHSAMKSETVIALLEALTKLLSVMTISLAGGTFNKLFNLLIESFHQHDGAKLSQSPSTQNAAIFATTSNSINQSINEMSVCSAELKDRLNDATLSTIANLISGNLELGITRLIEVAWNGDPKLRKLILEAVSRVLNQKSSNSATVQAEVHAKLCELHKLITIITDEGTLPLVNALINALPTENADQLSRVLVINFSEKHLLNELLWVILYREAECSMSPSTLFRGSSLASKIIGYCFRVYGHAYLHQTLTPLFQYLQENPNRVYEIEQEKVPQGVALEETINETKKMAELAFNLIVDSEQNFPGRLRSVCHALFHVINTRFPNSGLSALGKILFLRFFNPAIVSPYENQMMNKRPTKAMSRGLTLVSKILQATVNQSSLSKEGGMAYFQSLINEQAEAVNNFLSSIALNDSSVSWLESATLAPSLNKILLRNIHQLFSDHRCEIVSQLRLLTTHTNLCSRVDALLHALPEQISSTKFASVSDSGDSSLPPFYQINQVDNSLATFVLVLRRITMAEVDSVKKYIDEKCAKLRFSCVIDCLLCEYPVSLAKVFSTNIMPNIDKLIVLFCSPKVLTQLNEPYFNKTPIMFESSSIVVHYDQLPNITLRLMTIQPTSHYSARMLASNGINVTIKLIENFVKIERECKWHDRPLIASDVFACTAFEQIELINKNTVTFVINENQMMSLHLDDARDLVEKIFAMRSRNTINACSDAQIQIQANYEDVITLALVHIGDADVEVRTTAYKLLNFLISTLNLPIKAPIQDAPGIFVPSNCARFLTNIVTSLVNNRPQLMLSLLPKIIHHGSNGLLNCLKDSWSSLSNMEKESLDEIFAVLIVSSNHGPLSTLILNTVWPIIGQQHAILEHLLTHLLQSHISLTKISEICQALVAESLQFSVVVIGQTIAGLHASADTHIQKLLAMLLVISFNASNVILDSQLPNLMHILTCLVGTGSKFMCCAIFAITSNIFHSFSTNSSYTFAEDFHRTLSLFLQQLNSEETLRLFDVAEIGDGQVIINEAMRLMSIEDEFELYTLQSNDGSINEQNSDRISNDENHKVPLSNVHQLISLFMAIEIEKNLEGGRQWISEWRATSKYWAFHTGSSQNLQIRSLIAYSCLANSVIDVDIRTTVSLLLQVVKRRESLTSIAGVTLSLIRLHTLTPSNSSIHRLIFWIVILLFQLENAQIYEYGIQLLHANLVTLDQMGVFEHTSLEQIAMDARIHLEWDLKALDQYAGLSFRANFHFALIGYLLKGLRQPFLCTKVLQLIQLILRIIAKTNHCNPFVLSQNSLPYLLALLPFDDKVQQRFRLASTSEQTSTTRSVLPPQWSLNTSSSSNVIAENPIINVWNEDEEEETAVLLDPHVIIGEQLQSLTVTVLAILARSCPNVHLVLDFLLEAVSVFPSVVPVIECLLDQRIVGLVQSCHSVQMLSTVVRLIETSALDDSTTGTTPQQVCTFLQQSGFAGLWRYAGAFLSTRASRQAINANLISCLECILACL